RTPGLFTSRKCDTDPDFLRRPGLEVGFGHFAHVDVTSLLNASRADVDADHLERLGPAQVVQEVLDTLGNVVDVAAPHFHAVRPRARQTVAPDDVVDLLAACFPGGSITGAPKIRAMEIIRELETVPRGVYTGAIGFLGTDSAQFNVAIRTITVKDRKASFHAGGGIVADSDPEAEYEETLIKAKGMMAALRIS
ncbi:MAG: chorismate-binding protein, partial [Deltaproteobacteria bacterium]|nr:chorismate-binding protein [Deltaproteobacteria bacterium]